MAQGSLRRLGRFVRTLTAAAVFCTFQIGDGMGMEKTKPTGETPYGCRFMVGHRGAAGLSPENTLSGFKTAWASGVNAVELDVHLTLDGHVVVHHDYELNPQIARRPSGQWIGHGSERTLKNMSLETLKAFDVGRLKPFSPYALRFSDQKPVDGERIPTLREVFRLQKSRRDPKTQLWIEIKTTPVKPHLSRQPEEVVDAVLKVIESEGMDRLVRVLAFDWRVHAYLMRIRPAIPRVFLTSNAGRFDTIEAGRPGTSPWTAGLDIDDFGGSIPRVIKAAGGRHWAPRYNQLTYRDLEEAHGLGMKVYVWTPDKEADMLRLLEMGVDGIITNRPDILREVLGRS